MSQNTRSINQFGRLLPVVLSFACLLVAANLTRAIPLKTGRIDDEAESIRPSETTIVLFVVSLSCSHCYQQIELFAEEFTDVPLIIVSPQLNADIQERLSGECLTFVQDIEGQWNNRLQIPQTQTMHATVIVDHDGQKVWEYVDEEPLLDTERVRNQLQRQKSSADAH